MIDMNEIFENNGFSMSWTEAENSQNAYVPERKDLQMLLAELEDIKNQIEEIEAREWHLAKLARYHKEGFARE